MAPPATPDALGTTARPPASAGLLRSFLMVFGSQAIVLVVGFLKALVLPAVLDVSDYGYWQIYAFYTTYVGLFTLGYTDGIYLRYGGMSLEAVAQPVLRSANLGYVLILLAGAAAVAALAGASPDPHKRMIFLLVAANVVILGLTANISLTLQAANRLKGYAVLNAADKVFFALAMAALVGTGFRSFAILIAMDLLAKMLVLGGLLCRYPDLFIGRFASLFSTLDELRDSIGAGAQLLIANLAGMMVLGTSRMIVEYAGGIDQYASYALACSLASTMLVGVGALSIALYPALRQRDEAGQASLYIKISRSYGVISAVCLGAYFPARMFVDRYASHFPGLTGYLNVVFAITVMQGRMLLVNNTYFKTLRLERPMMVVNLTGLGVATLVSGGAYLLTGSFQAMAYGTLFASLLNAGLADLYLRRSLRRTGLRHMPGELPFVAAFLGLSTAMPSAIGLTIWLAGFVLFLVHNRQSVREAWAAAYSKLALVVVPALARRNK